MKRLSDEARIYLEVTAGVWTAHTKVRQHYTLRKRAREEGRMSRCLVWAAQPATSLSLSLIGENTMKSILTLIAASSLLATFSGAQTISYAVTDLGALGPTGLPYSITNNGVISGTATVSGGVQHAVLWYKGLMGDIGAPGLGGQNSGAFSVNERGQAVGNAQTSTVDPNGEDFCGFKASGLPSAGTTCLPYVWQYAVTIPLPTLGGNNGSASMINKQGTVAGSAENTTTDSACQGLQKLQFKPVIWQDGEVQELPTSSGDLEGVAQGINDKGQVVGGSGSCAALNPLTGLYLVPHHALLWETGTVTDLGNLGGMGQGILGNIAYNINNLGQVVGQSDLAGDTNVHAFLWASGTGMQDLGTLSGDVNSGAISINDQGEVVGASFDANNNPRAFLWQKGTITDLNTLIPSSSTLYLLLAYSINSSGQIVGLAVTSTGELHGFVATPSNMSSSGGTPSTGTTAVVTPLNLTTSASSLVLDGSGSTSASGNLSYLFNVVPGGKQAALLQTPTNPKATVDFVSGAGLYLIQLTVTDSSGNSAKSPVAMLNYQPATTGSGN
jgi:probable HAF family extracellular repeat protein